MEELNEQNEQELVVPTRAGIISVNIGKRPATSQPLPKPAKRRVENLKHVTLKDIEKEIARCGLKPAEVSRINAYDKVGEYIAQGGRKKFTHVGKFMWYFSEVVVRRYMADCDKLAPILKDPEHRIALIKTQQALAGHYTKLACAMMRVGELIERWETQEPELTPGPPIGGQVPPVQVNVGTKVVVEQPQGE